MIENKISTNVSPHFSNFSYTILKRSKKLEDELKHLFNL